MTNGPIRILPDGYYVDSESESSRGVDDDEDGGDHFSGIHHRGCLPSEKASAPVVSSGDSRDAENARKSSAGPFLPNKRRRRNVPGPTPSGGVLERGMWTGFLYLAVPPRAASAIRSATRSWISSSRMRSLPSATGGDNDVLGDPKDLGGVFFGARSFAAVDPLHISVSHVHELREWQIDPFCAAARRAVAGSLLPRFQVSVTLPAPPASPLFLPGGNSGAAGLETRESDSDGDGPPATRAAPDVFLAWAVSPRAAGAVRAVARACDGAARGLELATYAEVPALHVSVVRAAASTAAHSAACPRRAAKSGTQPRAHAVDVWDSILARQDPPGAREGDSRGSDSGDDDDDGVIVTGPPSSVSTTRDASEVTTVAWTVDAVFCKIGTRAAVELPLA